MMVVLLGCAVPTSGLRRGGLRHGATPVEKVITLLKNLEAQVTEDGAKEAAEYDKFACFCKEQASDKTYAIEKSDEQIKSLEATIEDLTSSIATLDEEVTELGKKIETAKKDIEEETDARSADHDKYELADKNVTEAIEAVESAIKAMKASKSEMKDAKVDLVQIKTVLDSAFAVLSSSSKMATLSILNGAEPGQPSKYEYRSNDIIAVLQKLLADIKGNKKTLDEEEFEAKADSDKVILGLSNKEKFATKSKDEKEALAAHKSEALQQTETDRDAEKSARDADDAFLEELQTQCETKAKDFDQRSKSRAAELTALNEATKLLETGVAPNYGANKKLVGLAVHAKVEKVLPSVTHGQRQPTALVQIGESNVGSAHAAILRAVSRLDSDATRLNSAALTALATQVAMQDDHFVKVRGLIKDLIARLEAQSAEEADSKSFCDKEMEKAMKTRDEQADAMEKQSGILTEKEAEVSKLKNEIASLSEEIAGLHKALNEATELRADEKKSNGKTLDDAKAGKAAVEEAIQVLSTYYGGSLVQVAAPNEDRDGKTVKDLAPETSFSGEYNGKQDASKGVMGLLEVIQSDFDRTITNVEQAESDAEKDFTQFETTTQETITAKKSDKDEKEAAVKAAKVAITDAKDALKSAEDLHSASVEELGKLKAMCVLGEESYAERKAKREKEIQALKEALAILEDWKA